MRWHRECRRRMCWCGWVPACLRVCRRRAIGCIVYVWLGRRVPACVRMLMGAACGCGVGMLASSRGRILGVMWRARGEAICVKGLFACASQCVPACMLAVPFSRRGVWGQVMMRAGMRACNRVLGIYQP